PGGGGPDAARVRARRRAQLAGARAAAARAGATRRRRRRSDRAARTALPGGHQRGDGDPAGGGGADGAAVGLIAAAGDGARRFAVIGQGGFGTVYAAEHLRIGRRVVVKVLRLADPEVFQRFRREAEITSSLGSRHIVQVFDFHTEPVPYLVMELLEGEALRARL